MQTRTLHKAVASFAILRGFDLGWIYDERLDFDSNRVDSGTAIPGTSRDDFSGIPVVVPSYAMQNAFGKIVGGWFAAVFADDHESRTLATLLPKLLSGELSVGESAASSGRVRVARAGIGR